MPYLEIKESSSEYGCNFTSKTNDSQNSITPVSLI